MGLAAPYMPLFVADYLADTQHLSAAEHGAYMLLLMNYWQTQKPLPSDDRKLSRIARMSPAEWAEARLNLSELFREEDGLWHHKRVDRELELLAEKSGKARAAARKSADVRSGRSTDAEQTLSERSTDVEPSRLGIGIGKEEKKGSDASASGLAPAAPLDPIDRLWGEGLPILGDITAKVDQITGKPNTQCRKLIGRWMSDCGNDAQGVLAAIIAARDHRVIDPVPWITQHLAKHKSPSNAQKRGQHDKSLASALDRNDERLARLSRPHFETGRTDIIITTTGEA